MIQNRTIFTSDNLPVLRAMDESSIDLIYLDPPFNSNRDYAAPIGTEDAKTAFKDTWTLADAKEVWWGEIADDHPELYSVIDAIGNTAGKSGKGYAIYMAIRLLEMFRILSPTGSIYLHCDPTASHGLKLLMDAIFGAKQFRNEIVWHYKGTGNPSNKFARKHDILLFYAKSKKSTFNRIRVPRKKRGGGGECLEGRWQGVN